MEQRIQLTCETCGTVHDLRKTPELPDHVFFLRCNWCPLCEDRAEDYYDEWWDEDENSDGRQPVPDDPNQLCLPFIFDEIGIKETEKFLLGASERDY